MNATDPLAQLKYNDNETLRQLLLPCCKGIYHQLYARSGNRETALQAIKIAFAEYHALFPYVDSVDLLHAMLFARAEAAQNELLSGNREPALSEAPDIVPLPQPGSDPAAAPPATTPPLPEEKPQPSDNSDPGSVAAIVFLSLGVAAALWVIIGLLMDFGVLPEFDLGYAWFSANVLPWF